MKSYEEQRDYVRELAFKTKEFATSKNNRLIIKRWQDTNALRKPDRAPVYFYGFGMWDEIITDVFCTDEFLKSWELYFNKILYKAGSGDDTIVYDYIKSEVVFNFEPSNMFGVDVYHPLNNFVGNFTKNPPLKSIDDISKLVIPKISVNEEKTKENYEKISELFGDIFEVRYATTFPLHTILGFYLADYVGMTEMMINMAIEPEFLHYVMEHITKSVISVMEQVEKISFLAYDTKMPMVCCEPFGPPLTDNKLGFKNLFISSNSQELDQVSPAMFEEFCLNYQKRIFEKVGRVCYGCCEDLTNKMDTVLKIPNLTMLVCSAWTNLDKLIDKCENKYTIMWRQKASDVIFDTDLSKVKQHLLSGAKKLKNSHYQIVLRELETIGGKKDRLYDWVKVAIEAASI